MATGMKIKKGDLVQVLSGKDRGKQGRVIEADPVKQRVMVENRAVKRRRGLVHVAHRGSGRHIVTLRLESEPKRVPNRWAWRNSAHGPLVTVAEPRSWRSVDQLLFGWTLVPPYARGNVHAHGHRQFFAKAL